jgi:LPXTG-motif cell wall-anchored protein
MKNKNLLLAGIGVLLAGAAAVLFLKKKNENKDEKPPKNAPQLDIENPGSHEEFPTAATESEVG